MTNAPKRHERKNQIEVWPPHHAINLFILRFEGSVSVRYGVYRGDGNRQMGSVMGGRPHVRESDRDLIRDIYPTLRRFAAVVAPVGVEPEDLVQESLYRALRRGRLDDLEHPTAYLRRSILNLASNHRRQAWRSRAALARLDPAPVHEDVYPSDVDDLLRLPPKARAVIYMRAIEGRSYAEIATELGCREATARATAAKARRQLKSLLSEEVRDATA